jgi:hypothetical protein
LPIFNAALKKPNAIWLILYEGIEIQTTLVASGLGTERMGKSGDMHLQIKTGTIVENPRKYEAGAVEQLRRLLEDGSPAQGDPRRRNFYEIESQNETYYIYVSPIGGGVVLLAKWIRQSQECCVAAAEMVAEHRCRDVNLSFEAA